MVIVILKMFNKEVQTVCIPQFTHEIRLSVPPRISADWLKIVPNDSTFLKVPTLVFVYRGKKRLCECGCTHIPIFEFDGVI